MLLSRQNKYGGVRLQKCPLEEENGVLAYKLGYCGHCNEPIRVRTIDAREFMCLIRIGEDDVKKVLKQLRPRITWREWLVHKLGGQVASVVDMGI